MREVYYAHTRENCPESEWQLLEKHINEVATLAGYFANKFDAKNWGIVVGLLHDLGKYQNEFQERIRGKKIRIDHATSGAIWAINGGIPNKAFAKIIAYCIAGHHTGLPDGSSGTDDTCLNNKLANGNLPDYFPKPEFTPLAMPDVLINKNDTSRSPSGFSTMFFTRMLFSCLKDADCLDTESFMDPEKTNKRSNYPSLIELKKKFDIYMKQKKALAVTSVINQSRNKILDECFQAAIDKQGLFSLTVPTGGGKTLSSMAFALHHALENKLERIIYVIPFISIIEQTAGEFKKIFGDENVIEHHSNIAAATNSEDSLKNEKELRRILATENWDAPVIVTTNIQFFESLLHNKTSRVRKIHNITNSVVILDEAQMLPVPFLLPTIEIIRELSTKYKTSIILCTATQPALNDNELKGGLANVKEIMNDPKSLEKVFRRVKTHYAGINTDSELIERIKSHDKVLCIVNTRSHARRLFIILDENDGNFHLSALMCPEHRFILLKRIRERLIKRQTCRVISTQLVEAGVDIDFPVVYRAIAGVDSIVQSAGRCNREGKIKTGGIINIFMPETGLPHGVFRQNAEITQNLLNKYGENLLSSEAVREYFNELYWRKSLGNNQHSGLDEESILTICREGEVKLDFPFKTVAHKYNLIKNVMESIIIPYDEKAKGLIIKLRNIQKKGEILRALQRYVVQVYPEQFAKLKNEGFIETIDEAYFILAEIRYKKAYSPDFGLNPEFNEFINPEEIIV